MANSQASATTSLLPRCGAFSSPGGSTQPQIDLRSPGRSSCTPKQRSLAISSPSTLRYSAATRAVLHRQPHPAGVLRRRDGQPDQSLDHPSGSQPVSTPRRAATATATRALIRYRSAPAPSHEIDAMRRTHQRIQKHSMTSQDPISGPTGGVDGRSGQNSSARRR
jgi:hypothetical protein